LLTCVRQGHKIAVWAAALFLFGGGLSAAIGVCSSLLFF
jgi:hypothetical protein